MILDINPTITSDEHPWSMNQTTEYENYYFKRQQRSSTTTKTLINSDKNYSFSTKLRVRFVFWRKFSGNFISEKIF